MQYLRLEWSKAQDTIKDLERKLQCEEHRCAILAKACGDLTETTLKRYLNEIKILQSKLKDRESLCPFTTRAGKKHIPFDAMQSLTKSASPQSVTRKHFLRPTKALRCRVKPNT